MSDSRKESVIRDAVRLMSVINTHLSEPKCRHTIRQIAIEALNHKEVDFKSGRGVNVGTGAPIPTLNDSPIAG